MLVSGRASADSATLLFGSYVVTWARASPKSTVLCVSAATGQRVAVAAIGDVVVHVTHVSVSPDTSLVAAIGTNQSGKPVATVGSGAFVVVNTHHSLTRVLAIDSSHFVVADEGDVVHLYRLRTDGSIVLISTQTLESVVDWVVIPATNNSSNQLLLCAIVRNSHINFMRLDGDTLKKAASVTLIPAPQRLAVSGSTLWLTSGKECCAVSIETSGAVQVKEAFRATLPKGATTRRVIGLDAVSSFVSHVILAAEDEGSYVDSFTVSMSHPLSSSSMAIATPSVTSKQLEAPGGQAMIAAGFVGGKYVGLISNVRNRQILLVPLTAVDLQNVEGNLSKENQRRMERVKAELSVLTHKVPTTFNESQTLTAGLLRVQDEARALQRSVEGLVADSAPSALLRELYVTFTKSTIRDLFFKANADTALPLSIGSAQAAYVEGLDSLRQVVSSTFVNLPFSQDQQVAHQRWAPSEPTILRLLAAIGVEEDVPIAAVGAGDIIIQRCGEQLTANEAVAAIYVILSQNVIEVAEFMSMAHTLLAAVGLSPSLFHWAYLLFLADNAPDTDIASNAPYLLSLDKTFDFGMSVMPRVIDALCCASNFEPVYLLIPSLLQTAAFSMDDRTATRFLLVARMKGNVPLIGTLVSVSRGTAWRAVALHVAAVAASVLKNISLLEGVVAEDEEPIIESALLRGVGNNDALRVFIDFLILQRKFGRALSLCKSYTTNSPSEHQAVSGLIATLRCLVPKTDSTQD